MKRPRPRHPLAYPSIPLRVFLIVPFVLLTSGTAAIVGYLSWRNGQEAVNHLAQQVISEVSDRVTLRLDTYLSTPHLINQLNADAIATNQLNPNDLLQLERHFWQQMQRFPLMHQISLGTEQGQVMGILRPRDTQALESIVTEDWPRRVYYSLDAQGNRQRQLRADPNFDPRVRPWYRAAVEANQATWSAIYPFFSDGELGISAVMPLRDAEGRWQGVLETNFSLHLISAFLRDIHVSPSGQTFIMERNSDLVAASTIEPPFTRDPQQRAQRLKAIQSPNSTIRQVAQQLQTHNLEALQQPTQFAWSIAGQRQFVQVVPYQNAGSLDWLIVVAVPESDFMERINANTRTSSLLSLTALISAIGFGLLLAHWITRPIQQLSRASCNLAQGSWHAAPQRSPIAELQVLTHSFDQTATQLQQSFDRVTTALQESEAKFTKVFRVSPDPIAIVTPEGAYLEVNDAFINLFGYSRAELLQHPTAAKIWHNPTDRADYVQQVQITGRVQNLEYSFQHRSGQQLTVLLSAEQIEIQSQACIIAIIKDITERHAIERMKHEFISIVSHELRTPLTAIRGFLGLLHSGMYDHKPEKAKHMVELALDNSDRLVRLVNDILDLERLDSGLAPLEMAVCQALDLIQKAVESVQPIADQAAITIVIAPSTGQVWAAADAIIQTLTNLLSNAIKFSPSNSIVKVSAIPKSDSVQFAVSDQGRGIPADKLETIFQRFQQVDSSDSRQKGGTGLGLAICQSIVQQHGGRIWAESSIDGTAIDSPEIGSTLYFILPTPPHDKTNPCD